MRIVGGSHKGRKINAPSGIHIRPTSDRIRESLFNILEHGIDNFTLKNIRVIDLFAGTGALGLEALSRGARYALFIEEDATSRGLIRENIDSFGALGTSKIFRRDATKLGDVGTMDVFSLALLDPPYGHGLGEKALSSLHTGGWLAQNSIIVLEEDKKSNIILPKEFKEIETRLYGNTKILLARYCV